MNRLNPYFCSLPSQQALRARAGEILEFCEAIIRIHREARDRRESELEGVRELEFWASDVLHRQN